MLLPWWPSQSAATIVCCLRTLQWLTIVSMVVFGLLERAFHHDQDFAPLCFPAHIGQQLWSLSVHWDCLSPPPSSSQAISSSPLSLLNISLPGLWDLPLPRACPLRCVAISSLLSYSTSLRLCHILPCTSRSGMYHFLLKSGCYSLHLTKLFWAIHAVIGQSTGTQ